MVLAYPSIFTHKGLTRLRKSGCLHPFLWLLALGLAAKRRRETTVIKLKLPALGPMAACVGSMATCIRIYVLDLWRPA